MREAHNFYTVSHWFIISTSDVFKLFVYIEFQSFLNTGHFENTSILEYDHFWKPAILKIQSFFKYSVNSRRFLKWYDHFQKMTIFENLRKTSPTTYSSLIPFWNGSTGLKTGIFVIYLFLFDLWSDLIRLLISINYFICLWKWWVTVLFR